MQPLTCAEFKPGRRFMGRLPYGRDLLTALKDFCMEASIHMATFSLIGAVSSITIGAYDPKQQVYVTHTQEAFFEIVNCTGNVSFKDGEPFVHAHILLADEQGKTTGGHLFSDTMLFAGEIDLLELLGKPLERVYDRTTGLMLWK
ncbi:MAG: DUF296 domain-containing protein [Proteobacteria bacterium]|nr:DUF296 domain-containing protein [Pseudomonadota bacterium]